MCIEIAKNLSQELKKKCLHKLRKIFRNRKITLESVPNCYIISSLLKDEKETETQFYRQMPRIPWIEHMNNEEVLKITETKRTVVQKERDSLNYWDT